MNVNKELYGELLKEGKYVEAGIKYVFDHNYVSFVELEKLFSPYLTVKGDYCITNSTHHTIKYWCDISKEFLEIFKKILGHEGIALAKSDRLTYAIDGRIINMDLAKRDNHSYKTDRWLPVVLVKN
tara:strand:- start:10818 stop:11195 length:378 start_codon:yes stop_codon:yes gene_type:complete